MAGGVGIFAGGWLTDLSPVRSLIAGYGLRRRRRRWCGWRCRGSAAVGIVALAVASTVGSVSSLAAQHRVLAGALRAPELASTLMSSVFNIGIALGASLGSWAIAAGLPFASCR